MEQVVRDMRGNPLLLLMEVLPIQKAMKGLVVRFWPKRWSPLRPLLPGPTQSPNRSAGPNRSAVLGRKIPARRSQK
eukprot:7710109-Pyramimonas_sp.AAC.1